MAALLKVVKFLCSHSLHIVLSLQTEKLVEQELCTNGHHLKRLGQEESHVKYHLIDTAYPKSKNLYSFPGIFKYSGIYKRPLDKKQPHRTRE